MKIRGLNTHLGRVPWQLADGVLLEPRPGSWYDDSR